MSKKSEKKAYYEEAPDDKDLQESNEVEAATRSLSELRYKGPPSVEPVPEYIPRIKKVSVYKARKFWRLKDIRASWGKPSTDTSTKDETNSQKSASSSKRSLKGAPLRSSGYLCEKGRGHYLSLHQECLSKDILTPERLTVCSNPVKEQITPPSSSYIRKPRDNDKMVRREISSSLRKESHSLKLHRKIKQSQVRQENTLMRKTGKNRESLLLRRHQLMPHISSTTLERATLSVERCVTPQRFPDWVLWAPIIYGVKEKNGISPQLEKRQRGYAVVKEWVGHPEITDEIRKELGLNEEHVMSSLKQNDDNEICTHRAECDCFPKFPKLGVLGFNYNNLQNNLRLPIRKMVLVEHEKQMKTGINDTFSFVFKQNGGNIDETNAPSRVSLTIGSAHLFWSTDPERSKKSWVIELGCSAEIHKFSMDYIIMRNTGTSVIHYNWIKKDTKDTFQCRRNDQMHIVFDTSGGSILPGEVYRLPFMYKAVTAGQFSEDWKLLTQPVLENGAEVILRLWGFTRQNLQMVSSTQKKIENYLKHKISLSIAMHTVKKLVDNLPLDETTFHDVSSHTQLKGPDLFLSNNPWLYYNSHHVDRLGYISKLIENELQRQTKLGRPIIEFNESIADNYKSSGTDHALRKSLTNESAIDDIANVEIDEFQPIASEGLIKKPSSELSLELVLSMSREVSRLRNVLSEERNKFKRNTKELLVEQTIDRSKDETLLDQEITTDDSHLGISDEQDANNAVLPPMVTHPVQLETDQIKPNQSFVNMVDPTIMVNSIRHDLIQCKNNHIRQDALFTVMSEEVSSLLFKPFYPCDNWKIPMINGLFSNAMQAFEDYALKLEEVCCKVHEQHELKEIEEISLNNTDSLTDENEAAVHTTSKPSNQIISEMEEPVDPAAELREETISNSEDKTISLRPRNYLSSERYSHQYFGRLYLRMYCLLSDLCDKMDDLVYQPPQIDSGFGKEAFVKIKKVPLNVDIQNELTRPLPPKWLNILHRMNKTKNQPYSDPRIAHETH